MLEKTQKELKLSLNKKNLYKVKPPILAIDYGEKNIGVAVSDTNGIIATPLENINAKEFDKKILDILEAYRIKTIVLGLPQEFAPTHKKTTEKIIHFKKHLKKLTQMEIFLYDESYSTINAYQKIKDTGKKSSKKRKRNKIDKVAATCFLQELIDFKNGQKNKET